MPAAKKITSSGNVYWLAIHEELGLILFDSDDQDSLNAEFCKVFRVDKLSYEIVRRSDLRTKTSAEITDSDSLRSLYRYRKFKNPPEPKVLTKVLTKKSTRVTHCWKCHSSLDNQVDRECEACQWITCGHCGACGCRRD